MSYYIGNYKGGRNESFLYGSEDNIIWRDYDLVSVYTTAIADLTLPNYSVGELIDKNILSEWKDAEFLKGYLIVNGRLQVP